LWYAARARVDASWVVAIFLLVEGLLIGLIPLYLFEQVERFLGLVHINLLEPNIQDFSTAERLVHWIAGVNMYRTHPLLGVGIGNYPDAYPHYYLSTFVNSLGHAHNYYINIAAETGTFGLAIYLFFIIALLVAGGQAVQQICQRRRQLKQHLPHLKERIPAPLERHEKLEIFLHPTRFIAHYRRQARFEIFGQFTNDRALAVGLMAALITVCVHNLVDNLYVHSLTNLLALLLIALIRIGTYQHQHHWNATRKTAHPAPRPRLFTQSNPLEEAHSKTDLSQVPYQRIPGCQYMLSGRKNVFSQHSGKTPVDGDNVKYNERGRGTRSNGVARSAHERA